MKQKICADAALADELREYIKTEGLQLDVVSEPDTELVLVAHRDQARSDMRTICAGGWIACETARALARELGLPLLKMGKMLDHLNVKIRQCSLGCFK